MQDLCAVPECRYHALNLYCVLSREESACSLCECVCVCVFTMRENLCNSVSAPTAVTSYS
jgi:hypothetical protein